jgi:transcriptional regulator with XRE-family HTH domain
MLALLARLFDNLGTVIPSYVGGLEAGQRNPTAVTLQRLAKVLRVTPTVFFL